MMEICVMIGIGFCNEDSKICRFNSIARMPSIFGESEGIGDVPLCDPKTETTLTEMYKNGWALKSVVPYNNDGSFLFFLEYSSKL